MVIYRGGVMKTRTILMSALLVGSTMTATAATTPNSYGTTETNSQYDSKSSSTSASDKRESAYDSAIKPDRTMRHDTREGRASTDTYQNQNDPAHRDWEGSDRRIDQAPATRE
jgi:hypothetical protein